MTDEEIGFEDLGAIQVPEKGDIPVETMVAQTEKKIARELIEDKVRKTTGTDKAAEPKPAGIPADVPKLMFRLCAKFIDCEKFNLDDEEARTVAHHLSVLIPVQGKLISVIIILMVLVQKCLTCIDAIKRKMQGDVKDELQQEKPPENLPEQIQ